MKCSLENLKQTDILEHGRKVLAKATSIPRIAEALAGIGYSPLILDEGKALIQSARELYEANIRIKDEIAFAYADFRKQRVG